MRKTARIYFDTEPAENVYLREHSTVKITSRVTSYVKNWRFFHRKNKARLFLFQI